MNTVAGIFFVMIAGILFAAVILLLLWSVREWVRLNREEREADRKFAEAIHFIKHPPKNP